MMGIRASIDFTLLGGCSANAMGLSMPCSAVMPGTQIGLGSAAIAPLALTVVSLLLLLAGTALGYTRKMSPKGAGMLMVVAGVAAIIAPIALALTTTPQTLGGASGFMPGGGTPGSGFWGSIDGGAGGFGTRIDWGPGFGWYASLFAAIVGFIGAFSAISGKPGPVLVAQTPPPGYYPVAYVQPYVVPMAPAGYVQPQYAQPQYGQAPYSQAGAYNPQPQPPPPPPQVQPRPTKNCPACGRLNWASSAACGECGASMGS